MISIFHAIVRPRRSWAVLGLALIVAVTILGLLGQADVQPSPIANAPAGAESTQVIELQGQLPSGDESTAVVLFTNDDGLDKTALGELQKLFADVATEKSAELLPSEDGTAAIGIVAIPDEGASAISESVQQLRKDLAAGLTDGGVSEGVNAAVTGPAAIQADLAAVFQGADARLLLTTAGIVAVLLLITYRSPFLWLVPLTVVALADQSAAVVASRVLDLTGVSFDESTIGILSVLVFGAGTDYALLLISRYRDELKGHENRYDAMRRAVSATSEAVLASSTTVMVGLITLLLSVVPATRGLGLACVVGVAIAAFAALIVLPCALVIFGRWIFWPLIPRVGQPTLIESTSLWRRVGNLVDSGPTRAILVCTVLIGGLAIGLTQVNTGLRQADQFLDKPEAISAGERLVQSYPAGFSDPTVVVTRDDVNDVVAQIQGISGVGTVRPGPAGDGLAQIDVVLADAPGSPQAQATVERLRDALDEQSLVGGTEAAEMDAVDGAARDRLVIIPLILLLVVGALVLLLKSLVAPLILVASVVATYFASLGASWWLFTGVFGFERLDVGVPLLAFVFLVALGVDYNIFLVTRAAEESREHGTRVGMLRALTATGGVITSAGILLAAVFAVLGVLPLVVLAQLGVVICVGVLLDTLLVRTVLVPAIAVRLEDKFWWPRRLHEAAEDAPAHRVGAHRAG